MGSVPGARPQTQTLLPLPVTSLHDLHKVWGIFQQKRKRLHRCAPGINALRTKLPACLVAPRPRVRVGRHKQVHVRTCLNGGVPLCGEGSGEPPSVAESPSNCR